MSTRSEAEMKYGLLGLLDVIKMTNRDLSTLALGCDLTTFGLNLNSTDSLYSTFTSPFAAQSVSAEPNYTTPACYRMHPPTLKGDHSSKFQVESLFYMFYAMPKDLMQAMAAQELYQREWRYHGEQRLWLKARSQQELMQSNSNVQYMYFDVNAWEARLFTNTPAKGHISSGFLTEEEIAVKPERLQQPPLPPPQQGQQQQGQQQQQQARA
jgi:CCR4-NOT transcription complex subunit 2